MDYDEKDLHVDVEKYRRALVTKDFETMALLAAQYIQKCSYRHGYQYHMRHFGACPECLKDDGCYHVGRDEWFVCHKHKVKWYVGSNLFSAWRDMTNEEFERNAEMLAAYTEVESSPVLDGPFPKSDTGIRVVEDTVEEPHPEDEPF